ncbi:hypothetical protein AS850_09740 [Frondihabitans sp. 762G35]|uniref:hypothetical protein n=1 Tax=Frondihabitans sp. 762G35 TaxID=1446794 RepID=UPI000D224FCC|nr:hypothetical protein [Frondihabitans sp. 762G35]ARC57356.1 hypothetical protein AS850_09740 [Frondihabitans sp. 762G35]
MARDVAGHPAHPDDGDTSGARRRRDLEARVYGGGSVDASDVAALRALLGAGAGSSEPGHPAPLDVAPAVQEPPPERPRPARSWFAGATVAVVLAALVGAGVATSLAVGDPAGEPLATRARVGSSLSPAVPVASSSAEAAAAAEALGAQYFAQPQSAVDRPTILFAGIDGSSTRRVLAQWGSADGEASVWVARGEDRSFCLVMVVQGTRAASSCTPRSEVAASGVRLVIGTPRGGSVSAVWDLRAGLLEMTPSPAGATVVSSGAGRPKP